VRPGAVGRVGHDASFSAATLSRYGRQQSSVRNASSTRPGHHQQHTKGSLALVAAAALCTGTGMARRHRRSCLRALRRHVRLEARSVAQAGDSQKSADLAANMMRALAANALAISLWMAGAPAAGAVESVPMNSDVPPEDANAATYTELVDLVDEGAVQRVDFFDAGKIVVAEVVDEKKEEEERIVTEVPGPSQSLIEKLQRNGVTIAVHQYKPARYTQAEFIGLVSIQVAIPFAVAGSILFLLRLLQERLFSFNRAEVKVNAETGVTFESVAGIDEAKRELMEIVDFLKTPERFTRVGAELPRGVLLAGSPGTGKTLMAKALAGESGVPFIETSASEFVEMYRGMGASRVRNVFRKAKEHSPCIVFIDEIDSIGRGRSSGGGGGSRRDSEQEQTLLQLLTEMDGFEANQGLIVLAATNRPEILDAALLRPGRFDRRVTISAPSMTGREHILAVHSAEKKLAEEVDLAAVARRTSGFTGAQLANLMNEAAILAARSNATAIDNGHISSAFDRVVAGIEGNPLAKSESKRIIAYHEAGHALVAALLPHHNDVEKVTILPRGSSRGRTWFEGADEDLGLASQVSLRAKITASLGGKASECLVLGPNQVTSSAMGDLIEAERMARAMVTQWGMSDNIGSLALENVGRGDGMAYAYSDATAHSVDREIRNITGSCYKAAFELLSQNRKCLDAVAQELLEHETLSKAELQTIIDRFKAAESP